jgi:hypothetical protein
MVNDTIRYPLFDLVHERIPDGIHYLIQCNEGYQMVSVI